MALFALHTPKSQSGVVWRHHLRLGARPLTLPGRGAGSAYPAGDRLGVLGQAGCRAGDQGPGHGLLDACRSLGVVDSALRRWVKQLQQERDGVTPKSKALTPEQQKIQELEARINRLERETEPDLPGQRPEEWRYRWRGAQWRRPGSCLRRKRRQLCDSAGWPGSGQR